MPIQLPNQPAAENTTCRYETGSQQNSFYLFKALFACCRRVECCFCSWAHSTALMRLSHLLNLLEEPPVSWCTLLPFFVSPKPFLCVWASRCQASFLQKNTQYSFQQTKCFYPSIFLINSVCLTCFLQVQYASLYAGSVNHTRQMWKLQVWTAGLTSNFQGFFVCRCSDISMQA